MWGYIGRRLLAFIPTVFVAVTLIFILTRLVPGNPVWALLGHQSVSAEQVDAMARELGLDRPILIQYLIWLPKALSGNFGQSIFFERPVAVVIAERFPVTLSIAGLSTLLTVLLAVPLGVLAATRRRHGTGPRQHGALHLRRLGAVVLAGVPVHPAVRGHAGLVPGRRLPRPVVRLLGVAAAPGAAGAGPEPEPVGAADAHHPHQHAGGAGPGVHRRRPRQGAGRGQGDLQATRCATG